MTIRAALSLWRELRKCHNIKFLLTGRLNQDSLENLFGQIRGKGRYRQNPDAREFRSAYRQIIVESLFAQSAMTNCKDDTDMFLLRLSNIKKAPCPQETISLLGVGSSLAESVLPNAITELMSVFEENDDGLSGKDKNVLFYIAGYIARKVSQKKPSCQHHLVSKAVPTTQESTFLQLKRFDTITDSSKGLITPTVSLFEMVQTFEIKYRQEYNQYLHRENVFKHLRNSLINSISGVCACTEVIIGLFLAIRIHHTLRDSNIQTVSMKRRKNQKMMKLQHM